MKNINILNQEEIKKELITLSEWRFNNNHLEADFVFQDFDEAVEFINLVAVQAKLLNHHPRLVNTYNKVSFNLSTHDAGDKITDLDIRLATAISVSSKQFLK